ncbi:hypothetical protein Clacol_002811 [Clathrus columnatus]|uniref:RING-type domain-containing protein n=1 Tax=Clathrus columnatus TaxID=1419009 RepID=A0AAV5A550_9AGAM|nr:hypothetical protein Clacol_002811 [Clathrus columnatus]
MTDLFIYDVDGDVPYLADNKQSRRFNSPSSDIVILDGPPLPSTNKKNEDQFASSSQFQDPFQEYLRQVLEIVPDVDHDYLKKLLHQYRNTEGSEQYIQFILHALFEDPSYPRNPTLKLIGKRRRSSDETDERAARKLKLDPSSIDRPVPSGSNYFPLALQQLQIDYPYIPKQHIRLVLAQNRGLYSPSYFFLEKESKNERLPYRLKTTAFRPSGKDRALYDPDFQIEREWLVNHLNAKDNKAVADYKTTDEEEEEDPECEDGIDCACCFSNIWLSLTAGSDGPVPRGASLLPDSGCKQPFPDSELARFLSPKLLQLYHRLKQQEEVAEASLEGLEECPFCEYKVVIENPDEKLFRCQNEECMAVTCRQCKKLDHLPKSCKEANSDATLDIRHTLEEAMSFIKDAGVSIGCLISGNPANSNFQCNKITCSQCGTISCYICRQIIKGYDHFHQNAPNDGSLGRSSSSKCILWDPIEVRHDEEVRIVAEKLREQLKQQNPDLPEDALNIDMPKPSTKPRRHDQNMVIPIPPGIQYPQAINFQIPGNPLNPHDNVRAPFQNQLMAIQAQIQQRALEGGRHQLEAMERRRPPGQRAYVGWQRLPELQGPPLPHIPLGPPQERHRRRR